MIDARWLDTSQYRIGHEARDAHAYINLFIALIQHGDFVTFSIPTLANCSCQLLLNNIILFNSIEYIHYYIHHEYLVCVPIVTRMTCLFSLILKFWFVGRQAFWTIIEKNFLWNNCIRTEGYFIFCGKELMGKKFRMT